MTNEGLIDLFKRNVEPSVLEYRIFRNQVTIDILASEAVRVVTFIKTNHELSFPLLSDLTAVDYLTYPTKQRERFAVVYVFYSIQEKIRVIVRAFVNGENPHIETISSIYRGANWPEREVYDLFGIHFDHHPDLRRILVPDYFEHHPLRKDYPVQGLGERSQHEIIQRFSLNQTSSNSE